MNKSKKRKRNKEKKGQMKVLKLEKVKKLVDRNLIRALIVLGTLKIIHPILLISSKKLRKSKNKVSLQIN